MKMFLMEDLYHRILKVRSLIKDSSIWNVAIERESHWSLVRVDLAMRSTVSMSATMFTFSIFVSHIITSISHGQHESKAHAILLTLRQEHPIRKTTGTFESMHVEI